MGLAASQAKLLFITARTNQVEAGLMSISSKEMLLTDKAADLSEQYNYNRTQTMLAYNGQAGFTYDMLMGESALNSGNPLAFLTNSTDNKVILDPIYATAAKAAGIAEKGGTTLNNDVKAAFLTAMGATSKSGESFENILAGKDVDKYNKFAAVRTFLNQYGSDCPEQGTYDDKTRPIKEYNDKVTTVSMADLVNAMGDTGNFTGISNLVYGIDDDGTQQINGQTNCNTSFEKLVDSNGYVCLIDDQEDLSYANIWKRAQQGFRNLANNITGKIITAASSKGLTGLSQSAFTSTINKMANQINGDLSQSRYGKNGKADSEAKTNVQKDLIEIAVDTTCTDHVKVFCNASELTRILLNVAANTYGANQSYDTNVQGEDQTIVNDNATLTQTIKDNVGTIVGYEQLTYKNSKDKTYEKWTAAYNELMGQFDEEDKATAEEYLKNQNLFNVSASQEDKDLIKKYDAILEQICANGWMLDEKINDPAYLASKLEAAENAYRVNGNIIANDSQFSQVAVMSEEDARAAYESELNQIEREEKKLEQEKTQLQTELTALNTEKESVQNIITKNIERSFNLFG